MSQPKVAIAITADDKTAKGAKSAEKRVGLIPKHLSASNRAWARDTQATVSRTSSGMIRSFGNVERATARALGGRSITSGITSRLGAVRAASAEAATGLAEAAEAGSGLSMMLGGLGVVAGATVGILGSLAYGAFRLVDGWSKGAATIGRMADTMGVARKEMQQFVAASERMGVDKGVASGGIASLSQTLNDARYGRNNGALAMLGKMGVKLQLHDDGTVDVEKMLPAIADAIARQNSSGRRTAAHALGLSDTMISVFAQGGKALAADMADADRTAYVVNDDDIARAQRIQRKGTMVSQMKDRAMAWAGSEAANVAEPGYDAVLSGGRALMGAGGSTSFGGVVRNVFTPGARSVEKGGRSIERAAQRFEGAVNYAGGGGGRLSRDGAISEARRAVRLRDKLYASGFNAADANALAANAIRESGADYRRGEKGGSGYGLFQWTNKKRKDDFRRVFGKSIYQSTEDEQIAFLKWEISNAKSEAAGWRRAHQYGNDAGSIAYGFTRHVERPAKIERDGAERRAVAQALETIPIKVEVEMRGAPAGTQTRVTAGRSKPAISLATQR